MSNIVLGEVRFSYVHVFQPYSSQQGDQGPRYSTTILIPKSNAALVQQAFQAIEAAKQEGVSSKWNGTMPAMVSSPIYDGDGTRPNGEAFGPECAGHYVLTASSYPDYPPEVVVGQDRHPATGQNEFYSGCYGYVSVAFFAYNHGRNGIRCSLGNVWKTRDGEPLSGGRTKASDDFGNIQVAGGSPSAAPGVPLTQSGYAPGQPPVYPGQVAPQAGQAPATVPGYPQQGIPTAPQPAYPGQAAPIYPAAPQPVYPTAAPTGTDILGL
ncbi:Protein of unknown function [Eubacterium aggregans]|uniref:DUF2815 family protein n=1 Tax=Eubacterium aggregans TaxID=81409 RepID=A0A1H3YW30_9FIRM|nr:DUF2815 family protein [Eubacterium aggregans]SEA15288.1 Protein of unknown function [Eubacterium aggregans]